MPTIFRSKGYRFFFVSFDGSEPMHVHVRKGDMDAKIWLSSRRMAWSDFKPHDNRELLRLVGEYEDLIRENGMSTSSRVMRTKLSALAVGLVMGRDDFTACLDDGRKVSVPYTRFPRLDRATPDQRRHFMVCGRGRMLHWPEIDEDIEVQHIVEGRLPVKESARRMAMAEPKTRYGKV